MKTLLSVIALAALAVPPLSAQTTQPAGLPAPTQGSSSPTETRSTFSVTERGMHHRVWKQSETDMAEGGRLAARVRAYTELATGMHYQKDGQWVESQARIDILPDGTAAATQGIHQVYFPNDIAQGVIEQVTPEGLHLQSRPLGLSYDDGSNTVLIAELKSSEGHLVGSNQVIYPDAFTDFKADVRYTYTRAGFEQDIILREQPPAPEEYQLISATTRLQVLTEFFNPPQPQLREHSQRLQSESEARQLPNQDVAFGKMRMIPGRAFALAASSGSRNSAVPPDSILTRKQWLKLEGRDFLLEEVDHAAVLEELQRLPEAGHSSISPVKESVRHLVSNKRLMPKGPKLNAANKSSRPMQLARGNESPRPGYVIDYQIVYETTDYLFRGDMTYHVNGPTTIVDGTIEGGTVIKYGADGSSCLTIENIHCNTTSYRPAIFTSMDDDSVGEIIADSTGSPGIGCTYLATGRGNTLAHIRMSYCSVGIQLSDFYDANPFYLSDAQFIHSSVAIQSSGTDCHLRNVLMADVVYAALDLSGATVSGEHLTIEKCRRLGYATSSALALTNSLLVNVTNLGFGFTTVNNATNIGGGIFQTVGAGKYYLATNSPYRDVGTTNINAALLANLKNQTTYPPLLRSNETVTTATTLSPQVPRDLRNGDVPDLGYHYDPLDYIVNMYVFTNTTLTVNPGTVIAYCNDAASIWLQEGSSIVSVGTPLFPNWFVHYSLVQEQPMSLGDVGFGSSLAVNPYHEGSPAANGQYRFTRFSSPAGGYNLYHYEELSYGDLLVRDCELYNGTSYLGGQAGAVATVNNNLFQRARITASASATTTLVMTNNLVWGTSAFFYNQNATNLWRFHNNAFHDSTITVLIKPLTNSHNAYINCTGRLTPTNVNDVVLGSFAYASGPLGDFYQASTNLLNVGSATADTLGLYHYTVTTNVVSSLQIKETNSVVDIGYHYLALNSSGTPVDTDGDGLTDYLEDANGNGTYDFGDLNNWQSADTDSDGMIDQLFKVYITRPANTYIIP